MLLWSDVALPAFATLFVIIDPLGLTPMFVALTHDQPTAVRQRVAWRSVLLASVVLLLFAFFGKAILALFGISMPAFRIAGGILLFMIALEMLFEKRAERRRRSLPRKAPAYTYRAVDDVWVFPLGIPLIAGPGAITSVILLMGRHAGDAVAQGVVVAILLGVLALTWLLFFMVSHAARFLSETAVRAISRVLGIILAALAVEFVLTGVRDAGLVMTQVATGG